VTGNRTGNVRKTDTKFNGLVPLYALQQKKQKGFLELRSTRRAEELVLMQVGLAFQWKNA